MDVFSSVCLDLRIWAQSALASSHFHFAHMQPSLLLPYQPEKPRAGGLVHFNIR